MVVRFLRTGEHRISDARWPASRTVTQGRRAAWPVATGYCAQPPRRAGQRTRRSLCAHQATLDCEQVFDYDAYERMCDIRHGKGDTCRDRVVPLEGREAPSAKRLRPRERCVARSLAWPIPVVSGSLVSVSSSSSASVHTCCSTGSACPQPAHRPSRIRSVCFPVIRGCSRPVSSGSISHSAVVFFVAG